MEEQPVYLFDVISKILTSYSDPQIEVSSLSRQLNISTRSLMYVCLKRIVVKPNPNWRVFNSKPIECFCDCPTNPLPTKDDRNGTKDVRWYAYGTNASLLAVYEQHACNSYQRFLNSDENSWVYNKLPNSNFSNLSKEKEKTIYVEEWVVNGSAGREATAQPYDAAQLPGIVPPQGTLPQGDALVFRHIEPPVPSDPTEPNIATENRVVGKKLYSITDYQGSVRASFGDIKLADGSSFRNDILGYYNYYPFGMPQPFRSLDAEAQITNDSTVLAGYQGMDKDREKGANGNNYSTLFRQYEPRLGRWLSVDPKPNWSHSVYMAFANNPNSFTDPLGDTVEGTTIRSASRIKETLDKTFHKTEHKKLRSLFKLENNVFQPISESDFEDATKNLDHNTIALARGYMMAINDDKLHEVTFIEPGEPFTPYEDKLMGNYGGSESSPECEEDWSSCLAEFPYLHAWNSPTRKGKGSFTFLIYNPKESLCSDYEVINTGKIFEETSTNKERLAHELIGHGVPRVLGIFAQVQAIQVTNLYLRVIGRNWYFRNGKTHGQDSLSPWSKELLQTIPDYLKTNKK